jgi:predicted dehydrogenase
VAERVRLIVAGAGAFGREHLRVLSGMPEAEIVGVADTRAGAARDAAAEQGVAAWEADAAALMERLRPDGVIVATPGATHVALARRALELGASVLVEKPVGQNAIEAQALAKAADGSAGFVLPGHILRFSDAHRTFVEIAQSDAVGRILSITARRHRDESHAARYPDDPVLMTMIHDIDLALWLTGAEPVDVLAHRRPPGVHRSETLLTASDSKGAVWRLSTAWTFPEKSCPPDRIEAIGERGSVEMEVGRAILVYGVEPRQIEISGGDPDQPLKAELACFVECIGAGRKPRVVTLADAVAGLKTADAAIASLTGGERVRP